MRTRSEGKQASGAGESHTQEANVAEVSYGKPVMVEPQYPDKHWNHPTVSDSGGSTRERLSNAPDKQVTNGVVGSLFEKRMCRISRTKTPHLRVGSEEPQRLLIAEDRLPGPVRRS